MSAVVLFSGGLDSTTCLYQAITENEKVYAISFDYSQRHKIELKVAKKITRTLQVEHFIVKLEPKLFQNSSLTDKTIDVPKNKISKDKIPSTYIPGRNTLFLSYAASFAESRGISKIYIGVNSLDYSGYPDCRPKYIQTFSKLIQLGTKTGVEGKSIQIVTPLIKLTKKQIVLLAQKMKVPFGQTHSCYDPIGDKPCQRCESCLLRKKGFEEAGVVDE